METFEPTDVAEWRAWLAENGETTAEIWLVIHHQESGLGIRIPEAVEQALCFGWIDGHHRRRDAGSSQLRFSPRGARSSWSAVNRERAAALIARGEMTERGQAEIDRAKANGLWEAVTDDDRTAVQAELDALLDGSPPARPNWDGFPAGSKRLILDWIAGAKKPETRDRRLRHVAALAADGVRANHPGAPPIGRA